MLEIFKLKKYVCFLRKNIFNWRNLFTILKYDFNENNSLTGGLYFGVE